MALPQSGTMKILDGSRLIINKYDVIFILYTCIYFVNFCFPKKQTNRDFMAMYNCDILIKHTSSAAIVW